MSPDHSTRGVPRRTWRAAVVLFLVVFLGGLGLTSAGALWSQQGTVQATVSTGRWTDKPQPGWSWSPEVTTSVKKVHGRQYLHFDWEAPTSDARGTRYWVTFQGGGPAHSESVDVSHRTYEVWNRDDEWPFMFTVATEKDGVWSESVVVRGTVDPHGRVVLD
ncbi:hypothetical protein [Citricoccus sp. I39-566]|uniref:hypothetical protein n=1 Tax=Citricoccus sp. I39-566 TaxID=3073268 RepID=UPI00286BB32C|nr:hypothetical protein [Citricoccus sp. I39-566]WMY78005.1 hypothetical protein RE421_14440 [Citricoccus sp. I39-566]